MNLDAMPWPITLFFMIWTLACVLMLKRGIRISQDIDGFLKNHKKGQNLVEQQGYDKARKLVKNIGVPFGILFPLLFLLAGISMYFTMVDLIASGELVIKP
ncbi:hypothetical protein [Oceanobacter mangrovi]|uniref:hypothetical protein n=1 Tax=Oceanobacter mangrovi TaxID=2862510 RepID=UPI001C8F1CDD|nr:hypothetical protein [Oceanobacter mangrovi]